MDIYGVVSCDSELPIYQIKPENSNKLVKTIDRNLLLKCNKSPFDNKNLNLKNFALASKTSLFGKKIITL